MRRARESVTITGTVTRSVRTRTTSSGSCAVAMQTAPTVTGQTGAIAMTMNRRRGNRGPRFLCGSCQVILLIGLKQEAPEKQNAEVYQDSNDDDLNETHCRFLGWK